MKKTAEMGRVDKPESTLGATMRGMKYNYFMFLKVLF